VTRNDLFKLLASSQFIRFGVVGAGGYVVDASVLFLMLHWAKLDPYSGRIVSYLAAATFTWVGNRYLTFADQRAHLFHGILREWVRFLAANAIGGLVNVGLYATLVRYAPPPVNNPFVAQLFGVAAGLVFNFTLSKRLVFREPPVA
jgi:putative flippase GtrA